MKTHLNIFNPQKRKKPSVKFFFFSTTFVLVSLKICIGIREYRLFYMSENLYFKHCYHFR